MDSTREPEERLHLRKEKLLKLMEGECSRLHGEEKEKLEAFLLQHHDAFALDDKECGETDLIQFEINTGDALPKKQPLRRMPFAVRQEVGHQLREMQAMGVIRPSNSPWASPNRLSPQERWVSPFLCRLPPAQLSDQGGHVSIT